MMGSTPPANAAMEALMRSLAIELGTSGIPETLTPEKIAAVNSNMVMDAAGLEELKRRMAEMTPLRRMPALSLVAEVAAFLASGRAGAMTGTITNVTCGLVPV